MSLSPVLELEKLSVSFHGPRGVHVAVSNISLTLEMGRSLAIVGESGSGKSVTGMALARLLPEPPARVTATKLRVTGHDVLSLNSLELRALRGREIAYIFQDPTAALNPVYTIGRQMRETLSLHRPELSKSARAAEVCHWLERVGIREAKSRMESYPHEFSGGMLQRVVIAMALCAQPRLVIADEPTTALDVTLQRQIMALLSSLKSELDLSIVLITHNFGIIRDVADDVAVMFRGKIVEHGPIERVLSAPTHPYTRALLACVPRLDAPQQRLATIDYGEIEAAMVHFDSHS